MWLKQQQKENTSNNSTEFSESLALPKRRRYCCSAQFVRSFVPRIIIYRSTFLPRCLLCRSTSSCPWNIIIITIIIIECTSRRLQFGVVHKINRVKGINRSLVSVVVKTTPPKEKSRSSCGGGNLKKSYSPVSMTGS